MNEQESNDALWQDYQYELLTETGYGSPKLWDGKEPRSFQDYARKRLSMDLQRALDTLNLPSPTTTKTPNQ